MRHVLYERGFTVELLASFEPSLTKFHEWWKQLFGESEGKQGKGLYPSTVTFVNIGVKILNNNGLKFPTYHG